MDQVKTRICQGLRTAKGLATMADHKRSYDGQERAFPIFKNKIGVRVWELEFRV